MSDTGKGPATPAFPVPDPITADWLTNALEASGALGQGAVESVEWEAMGAFNSATMRLRAQYSADAPTDAPTRLILKRNIAQEWAREAGADEVRFYQLVASLPDHPRIIAPCFAAAHDPASGDSYLLLQDLSATHHPPVTRDQQISIVDAVPPTADIDAVVETLAQLHAYWWDSPLLDSGQFPVGYWSRTRERFEQYLQRRTAAWRRMIEREGDWLPEDVCALYEQALARLPSQWERFVKPRFDAKSNLTLIHNDAYFANFLCPRTPGSGPTYLLDWQSPEVEIGGYDLANLLATFWTSEQRHENRREEQALRHYHATLQAHSVGHYTWDDLLIDYRLGLIVWLLIPVQDAADGSRKDYWWPKMQCLLAAFRDWRCGELLGVE